MKIAIDGPAASGKTSLGRALARHFGCRFVETGKMYRAVALALERPEVRERLVALQRAIADRSDVVMEGRDIGTVVLPDADVKIFLRASPEVRARRRAAQRGDSEFERTLREIIRRDERDSTREVAPLNPASDAAIIDTDRKTLTEVISEAIHLVKERLEGRWDDG